MSLVHEMVQDYDDIESTFVQDTEMRLNEPSLSEKLFVEYGSDVFDKLITDDDPSLVELDEEAEGVQPSCTAGI